MSQLTANSVIPIVSALPDDEKRALIKELQRMVGPSRKKPSRKKPSRKKRGVEVPWLYTDEGHETLVAKIINGTL